MKTSIELPSPIYKLLRGHLFPVKSKNQVEEAAFLFMESTVTNLEITFRYKGHYLVAKTDYVSRSHFHFELKDELRGKIIKEVHSLGCTIVEAHSHVDQTSAQFSPTDWLGFGEFVPHVMWRLKGKPYAALVFANTSFDACVWPNPNIDPIALNQLLIDSTTLIPTNNSITDLDQYKS